MEVDTKVMTKDEYDKRREKILTLRKTVLTAVEELIEPEIDEQKLIENCKYLSKNDYYDVTVERSVTNCCGYPLCTKELDMKTKKKYKIVLQTHQVFDLTDRKMFCSNLCFSKSNCLKDQLEEEPLWIRGLDNENVKLTNATLSNMSKSRAFGDEIKLDINLTRDLIQELHKEGDSLKCKLYCSDCCSNTNQSDDQIRCKNSNCKNKTTGVKLDDKSISFPYIQEDDLNSLKDKLKNLKIKEKVPTIRPEDTCQQNKPVQDQVIEKFKIECTQNF